MNREKFMEEFAAADDNINKEWASSVIESSLYNTLPDGTPCKKGFMNMIIVMEELSELSQEVSKYLRGEDVRIGIMEELADVWLCMEYIKRYCNISEKDLNKAINVKLNALQDKLEDKEIFRSNTNSYEALKAALETGIACDLETIGEAVLNIRMHAISLFLYQDIEKEFKKLISERNSLFESTNFSDESKIADVLEWINMQNDGIETADLAL